MCCQFEVFFADLVNYCQEIVDSLNFPVSLHFDVFTFQSCQSCTYMPSNSNGTAKLHKNDMPGAPSISTSSIYFTTLNTFHSLDLGVTAFFYLQHLTRSLIPTNYP